MGGIASPSRIRGVVTADGPRKEDTKDAAGKRWNMMGILVGRGSCMARDLYQGEFAMINRRRD